MGNTSLSACTRPPGVRKLDLRPDFVALRRNSLGSAGVRKSFPAWFLGLIGGAGALTAMVPAAVFILTAATLFAKNLYRPIFAPAMTDDQVANRLFSQRH